jgi:hypothetical protein
VIIEYGHTIFTNLIVWLFTFIPAADGLEGLATGLEPAMSALDAGLSGLGSWIPWGVGNAAAVVTLGFWAVALVVRVVKSFLPTMSG